MIGWVVFEADNPKHLDLLQTREVLVALIHRQPGCFHLLPGPEQPLRPSTGYHMILDLMDNLAKSYIALFGADSGRIWEACRHTKFHISLGPRVIDLIELVLKLPGISFTLTRLPLQAEQPFRVFSCTRRDGMTDQ